MIMGRSMLSRVCFGLIVVSLFISFYQGDMGAGGADMPDDPEPSYTVHAPIRINSNADFDLAHGVVNWATGDGSGGNPWIIQNWDIDGTGYSYCIYIGNTTDHFVLSDSYLHDTTEWEDWPYGPTIGLVLNNVHNGTIRGNDLSNNPGEGIHTWSAVNCLIENNVAYGNGAGIRLDSSSSCIIRNNNVSNNMYGLFFTQSTGLFIHENNISMSTINGILLSQSNSNFIYHNNFIGNTIHADDDNENNNWDNGYPSGGNYWDDHSGMDIMSGPDQDIPGSDDLGDTPYMVDHNSNTISVENETVYFTVFEATTFNVGYTDIIDCTIYNDDGGFIWMLEEDDGSGPNWDDYVLNYTTGEVTLAWSWWADGMPVFVWLNYSEPIDIYDNYPLMEPLETRSSYTAHRPIRIDSNMDFDEAHGVVNWHTGDGTEGNPWIIEGYDINGIGASNSLYVGNTTDHFIFRDCIIHDTSNGPFPSLFPGTGIALTNVDNGIIENNIVYSNLGNGIGLENSHFNTLINNTIYSNTNSGIILMGADNNYLERNSISDCNEGIYIFSGSDLNIINNNTVNSNRNLGASTEAGIEVKYSDQNTVTNNTVLYNEKYGISLGFSIGTIVKNNNVSFSGTVGIYIVGSQDCIISKNTMYENGIKLAGNLLEHYNTHYIDTQNTVNGKPVIYWYDVSGGIIPPGAGQVILANCSYIHISGQILDHTSIGITLGFSSNNTIKNNEISYNQYAGIDFGPSVDDNIIRNNTINDNYRGCYIGSNDNNLIYHNNFINNPSQAYDYGSNNTWDIGYPGGGNYWSDYDGVDNNCTPDQNIAPADGVGDTPHSIFNSGQDNYPLMAPWAPPTTYNIDLAEGWNLVSLPLIRGDYVDSILSSISGKWDSIQAYDPIGQDHWKINHTTMPDQLNDLEVLDYTMGFWINITETCTLEVWGSEPSSTAIQLYAGWNLVGYPTLNDTVTVADALLGTGADIVEAFNASQPYNVIEVGPGHIMQPGEGYWVHVPADTIWTIDW